MAEFFQEEQLPLIPEETTFVSANLSDNEKQELTSQAVIASKTMNAEPAGMRVAAEEAATFGGSSGVRNLITETEFEATKRQSLVNISELASDGTVEILADQMLSSVQQVRDEFALEDKAVETLANVPIEIQEVVDRDVLTDMASDQAFQLKIRNFIAENQGREDEEGFFTEIVDFFKLITPIQVGERFIFGGGEQTINDNLRNQLFIASKLPPEEQDAFLRGPIQQFIDDIQVVTNNPNTAVELMSAAIDGSDKALADLKFWQAIDILVAPFDLAALKAFKGGNIAKVLNNKKVLAEDIVQPIEAREILKTDTQVIDAANSFKAPFDQTDGVAGEIAKSLEKNERLLNDTLDNFTAPESLSQVEARKTKEFESSYGANRIMNSNLSLDKKGFMDFTVGTVKGVPFKSERTAQKFIDDNNITGKIIKHTAGGFSVKMKTPLGGIDSATVVNLSWMAKNYGNIDNIVSQAVVAGGRAVEGAMNQVFQTAAAVHKNSMKLLTTKRGKDLLRVMDNGIDEDKWLNPEELLGRFRKVIGRDIRKDEVEAYFAFKQLNDFDYELKLKILRDDSIARGERTVTLENGLEFNAAPKTTSRILKEGKNAQAIHVFESNNANSVTIGKGGLDEVEMVELQRTHDLVEVNPDQMTRFFDDGVTTETVKWFFVPKASKFTNVNYNKLAPYKAGGRRRNNSPAYLKIARIKNGSAGAVRMPDIATHGSASKKQAKITASSLNEIFDVFKKAEGRDLGRFDELVESKNLNAIGISSARQADEFFSSHNLYNYDSIKFDGVRDRELVDLKEVKDLITMVDETEEPIMSSIRNAMNGKRGERLKNLDGENSLILDPLAALADSLDTTTRFASVRGYRQHMLAFMQERFGRYLNHNPASNPIEILTAKPHQRVLKDRGLVRVIEAHQRYIEEVISKRNGYEEEWLQKAESAVNWAFDKGSEARKGLQDGWVETGSARQAALRVATKDPAGRLKNLVFNAKLGLFNVPSFIMQALNVVNITALSPKYGMKASMHAVPMRLALAGGVDKPMREVIAKGWKEAGFKSKDDFLEYMSEFEHLGLGHLDRGIAEISGANGAQLGSSRLSAVADAGRFFFNQGELISRVVSYGAARLRWLDDSFINPKGLSAKSPEGRVWIQNESHRLSLGLSRADVQLGFRGLAGVPFQFWSYPFRLTGAMLPKVLGGGVAFTGKEKARLFLANAFIYGSAGIPVADALVNQFTSTSPDLDALTAKALTNGFIDSVIYGLSDGQANTNLAGRGGVGQFFTDIARDIRDKSTGEFVAGAGGNTLTGIMGSLWNMTNGYGILQNPNIDTVSEAGWSILKAEISALKLADKTKLAIRFGYLFTKSGARHSKISNMETFLMVGGLPPQAYENISQTFSSDRERRETIKHIASMFISVNLQLDDAIAAGDTGKANNMREAITILGAQAQDQRITDEVMRAVRAAETQGDMLEARAAKMFGWYGGVGTNEDVIRQEIKQEKK